MFKQWIAELIGKRETAGRPEATQTLQTKPIETTEVCSLEISKLVGRLDSHNQIEFAMANEFLKFIDIGLPEDFRFDIANWVLECWKDESGVILIEMVVGDKVIASREFLLNA